MRRLLVPLAAALALSTTAYAQTTPSRSLLLRLAIMATGASPTEEEITSTAKAIAQHNDSLDAYVDRLLHTPAFGHRTAPLLVLDEIDNPPQFFLPYYVLSSEGEGAARIWSMRQPCKESDSTLVAPWWAPTTKVRVCNDSYRPELLTDPTLKVRCGAPSAGPQFNGKSCGCGKALMWCAPRDLIGPIQNSLNEEVRATIASTIDQDRPLSDIYVRNDTVRGGYAQFFYEREQLALGKITALHDPRAFGPARALPRTEILPGEHAGILTAVNVLYRVDSERDRMRMFSERLWCSTTSATAGGSVSTEAILALGPALATGVRDGGSNSVLAKLPVCTTCHARLDSGMAFFMGFPAATHGYGFVPTRARSGMGELLMRDNHDPRGEGLLTPAGFAALAVTQPEFASCAVSRVAHYVFADTSTSADSAAIRASFAPRQSLRDAMRAALLRYAQREQAANDVTIHEAHNGSTLSPEIAKILEDNCVACHDSAPTDFRQRKQSRELLDEMAQRVAFGAMPRTGPLDYDIRHKLVAGLVDAELPSGSQRQARLDYLQSGMHGMQLQPVDSSLEALYTRTHVPPSFSRTGRDDESETILAADTALLTPGWIVRLGLEVLRACRAVSAPGMLDSCMERALPIDTIVR